MEEHVRNLDLCQLLILAKTEVDYESVVKLFQSSVQRGSQTITGFLLKNAEYIIYLLESKEDDLFRTCNEMFTSNLETFVHVKCLDIQNSVNDRLFNKWYTRKISINNSGSTGEVKVYNDDPKTIEMLRKTMTTNLYKLFTELSAACNSKNHVRV